VTTQFQSDPREKTDHAIRRAWKPSVRTHWQIPRRVVFVTAVALASLGISVVTWRLADSVVHKRNLQRARDSVALLEMFDTADRQIATGSGFFISADGMLVTNFHVIKGATRIVAKLESGATYEVVRVVASDENADIVLLRVNASGLRFLRLGNSTNAEVGQHIILIGSPLGFEGTVSDGIISAKRELPGNGKMLQITAPIAHGSSGSPVLDVNNEVLGVASLVSRDGQALNFAVPVEVPKALLAEIKPESGTHAEKSRIYVPTLEAKGSREQDESCSKDPLFIELKESERRRDYFAMISPARDLVKKYPKSALAHRVQADALYYAKMFEDSIVAAKQAIDLDPENPRGWNNLAILYEHTDQTEAAEQIYKQALERAPEDAKLLIEYARLKDVPRETALSALNYAGRLLKSGRGVDVESSVYPLEAHLVLGYLAIDLPQDAYQYASSAVTSKQGDVELWLAFANAAGATKRFEEVRPALLKAKAYTLDKRYETLIDLILGDTDRSRGDMVTAKEAFTRVYSADPSNVHAMLSLIDLTLAQASVSDAELHQLDEWVTGIERTDPKYGAEVRDQVRKSITARFQQTKR
jgi:S1-C subfamily serine protease/tetratricopeptide (TPR) repeat protein